MLGFHVTFWTCICYLFSWNQFFPQVPPWIDIAIFERPGHGQRSSEPLAKTLVDEAKEISS